MLDGEGDRITDANPGMGIGFVEEHVLMRSLPFNEAKALARVHEANLPSGHTHCVDSQRNNCSVTDTDKPSCAENRGND